MLELLDPTNETKPTQRPRNSRPDSLNDSVIGLLDIHKLRGDVFLDEVDRLLTAQGHEVRRYQKLTYAHPAGVPLQQQIAAECDVVLEGLAD